MVSQVCADAGRGTLAKHEKNNLGYMSRELGLTLLAPDIVEAILAGRQPDGVRLHDILIEFPESWGKQETHFN